MENLNVNVPDQKIKITSYIKINGPVVAQNVAKKMNLPSFLASALLSELLGDKLIKASHLRVGGTPLYFVSGQEDRLDGYTKFLAFKEREAHKMLKEKGILEDSLLEPPIRVAFRIIKDFAIPLSVSSDGEEKLFWKFHTLAGDETQNKIRELLKNSPKVKKNVEGPKVEKSTLSVSQIQPEVTSKQELVPQQSELSLQKEQELPPQKVAKPKVRKKKASVLPLKVQEWARRESVLIKQELESEGKMFRAVVEVKSAIGSLDFLLIAIDKKSVNEGELALCYQEGLERKLPILLLMNGKPSKKGQKILEGFKGHVTMRKL